MVFITASLQTRGRTLRAHKSQFGNVSPLPNCNQYTTVHQQQPLDMPNEYTTSTGRNTACQFGRISSQRELLQQKRQVLDYLINICKRHRRMALLVGSCSLTIPHFYRRHCRDPHAPCRPLVL
uniref:Uncharacterized protein n=1 Tax=Hyaloperonospora arabidopsidis (strain Emoy2) TaxID=559515 RepID=M4BJ76_HYAAE